MMKPTIALGVAALLVPSATLAVGISGGQIQNLVTFGDSYTSVDVSEDGGQAWPVYAAGYANVSLFPFARAGATCSPNLTYSPYASLLGSELPLYFQMKANGSLGKLDSEKTLYTNWIGTNDVGYSGLLTGQVSEGVSVINTTDCAVSWVQTLYNDGARNFLFQNLLPLQLLPNYAINAYPNQFWTAARNTTEWNIFMTELVYASNAIAELKLTQLAAKLPGAHIGLFDSYSLFNDMYHNPSNYLNGTAPLNVTGAVVSCIYAFNESTSDTGDCTVATGSAKDSFLWENEMHPSEQSDRVIARYISQLITEGVNEWTRWLS